MIQIRNEIKKSKSCVPVIVAFLILFNYCGFQALTANAERAGEHAAGSAHPPGVPNHHEDANLSGSPHDNNSCCPEMFCCTSLKLTGDIKELFSRFVSPPVRNVPIALVFPSAEQNASDQHGVWMHANGPPASLVQLPFFILEYPSHAPPSA
ncbi:MAG: hypothetical protein A3G87_00650 [Omnitrophica bacterium RIFCSPLOWO2_12_FULL_50_11]|nr:MAG: hypothetical protein A3G87_00650 [Omnitrophica bacterium RIFCSPLOWO2_12_FULL_50_11]